MGGDFVGDEQVGLEIKVKFKLLLICSTFANI